MKRKALVDKKMRILIAEDSEADKELFLRVLRPFVESQGLRVDCASDGDDALTAIKNEHYDVVFLDESMPGPNGLEIAAYIKKNQRAEKVVILTGYSDLDEKFSKSLGADEFVKKPIDPQVLGAILEKYVPRPTFYGE